MRDLTKVEDGYRVLFVDVTNGGGLNTLPPLLCEPACVRAKLKPGRKWLARTPAIVAVKDGIVQSVTFE